MKRYKITVTEKQTKKQLLCIEEFGTALQHIRLKYKTKYRFVKPECIVKVVRLTRKPDIQTSILDFYD